MNIKSRLTYKKSGVDIDEGDRFVSLIGPLVKKTFRPEVLTDIGSFGALFKLDIRKYKNPVLVSGTDGVGTKLKIAFLTGKHDTIGIDLVAMCVNDILTSGAEPLFFLDYFATGRLKPEKAALVLKGIADGCMEAGCSLVGGETAEMPGFYHAGEYDLAGFAVGIVEKENIINGTRIGDGDALIGITSNGLHSNGYSLARKIFFDLHKKSHRMKLRGTRENLGSELLRPTRIYVNAYKSLRRRVDIKGMAHITGGGIPGNLPRIFPEKHGAIIDPVSWPEQPIFEMIRQLGNVPLNDMRRTFNMGIGYVLVVSKSDTKKTLDVLATNGYDAYIIGNVKKGLKGVHYGKN